MRRPGQMVLRVTAAALFALALAASAPAQTTDPEEARAACERATGRERRRCEQESGANGGAMFILRAPEPAAESWELRLPLSQIVEDLAAMRSATDELSEAASRGGELDRKIVAKSASEVMKRARRLRESLALPGGAEDAGRRREVVPLEPAQLRAALSTLSTLISDAINNPVLRGRITDTARSAEARKELDEIVELSGRIKMSCEAPGKARR